VAWFASILVLSTACATSVSPDGAATASATNATGAASASSVADPIGEPSLDGRFAVDESGLELAITCWGSGDPMIIIEGGDPDGRDNFGGTPFVRELLAENRVCLYDRAGGGDSDPAPNEPRDLSDVVDYLAALRTAAGVDGPTVLVGSSFGGDLMIRYAARHPEGVVGVVLIDTPAPEDFTLEEFPEGAWDHPGNVEHINLLEADEPLPIDAPLLVITAGDGASSAEDQAYWLQLSPDSRQVEMAGGHDVYEEDPQAVAKEILGFIRSVSSNEVP
jgi:pimeloyl-ACP methyl ester carboxylesterase